MSYQLVEGGKFLANIGTNLGMSEVVDAVEKMPYDMLNKFLETGDTKDPIKVQREIGMLLASFSKRLKPDVVEILIAMRSGLQKASMSAQIQG